MNARSHCSGVYRNTESQLIRVQASAFNELERDKKIETYISNLKIDSGIGLANLSRRELLDKVILTRYNLLESQRKYGWWQCFTSLTKQSIRLIVYVVTARTVADNINDVLNVDYRMISNDGDYSEFIQFCHETNFPFLRDLASAYLVLPGALSAKGLNVENSLDKLFIRLARLSLLEKAGFIVKLILNYFYVCYCILRDPGLMSIAAELLTLVCFDKIKDRVVLKNIVFSNSFVRVIPLWVTSLSGSWKTSVVWYSESSVPYQYTSGIKLREEKHLSHVAKIDANYVWTDRFADYSRVALSNSSNFIVSGPILFRPKITEKMEADIDVLVFNTSPFSWEALNSRSELYDYNNEVNCIKFFSDIVAQSRIGNFVPKIVFKSARRIISILSKDYFEYLDGLKKSQMVEEVHFFTNMYALLSRAKCVVVMPFSSPALVAKSLKIPVVYYDPMNLLVDSSYKSGIPLISSEQDLGDFFAKYLNV